LYIYLRYFTQSAQVFLPFQIIILLPVAPAQIKITKSSIWRLLLSSSNINLPFSSFHQLLLFPAHSSQLTAHNSILLHKHLQELLPSPFQRLSRVPASVSTTTLSLFHLISLTIPRTWPTSNLLTKLVLHHLLHTSSIRESPDLFPIVLDLNSH